jgi:hypothetical protein
MRARSGADAESKPLSLGFILLGETVCKRTHGHDAGSHQQWTMLCPIGRTHCRTASSYATAENAYIDPKFSLQAQYRTPGGQLDVCEAKSCTSWKADTRAGEWSKGLAADNRRRGNEHTGEEAVDERSIPPDCSVPTSN